MPSLDPAARRALRARAHHLHPVVAIGQHGLTPAVLHEIDVALTAHELIKVRVFSDDRSARETLLDEVCAALGAAPVQHLGKLLVLWRANPDKPRPARKAMRKPEPPPRASRGAAQPRAEPVRRGRARGAEAGARSAPPSGVPRAGLPRRRRARS